MINATALRTLARCALAAMTRKESSTLSLHAEAILEAWCDALPFVQRELGESFGGSLHDTIARRAVGMALREQTARQAVQDELQALLTRDDTVRRLMVDDDMAALADTLMMTAIGAYHAALVKGQS